MPDLVKRIDTQILWQGRSGKDPTWFHPRPCMVPSASGPVCVMTLQLITGSDVFHQVHWTRSTDLGKTWVDPVPIEALGRLALPNGLEEGVCDVVPEFHPQTKRVLAMGHNVYYKNGHLTKPSTDRHPVYVVGDAAGHWSERRRLKWDDPRASAMYTSNCGQRVTLANGDILVPVSFGPQGRRDRAAGTLLCSFDGNRLAVKRSTKEELRCNAGRGLLEPSLTRFGDRFYMTIRAEDGHGYVAVSDDGLTWQDMKAWTWEDGEALTMSTTQQHWVTHSDGLFLAYTRKAEHNPKVMRWRAPIFMARVDLSRRCLIRATERVVLPLIGDGVSKAAHVARMGNFHVVNATPEESWVTVGECLPNDGWRGNTLLARIVWQKQNRLCLPSR